MDWLRKASEETAWQVWTGTHCLLRSHILCADSFPATTRDNQVTKIHIDLFWAWCLYWHGSSLELLRWGIIQDLNMSTNMLQCWNALQQIPVLPPTEERCPGGQDSMLNWTSHPISWLSCSRYFNSMLFSTVILCKWFGLIQVLYLVM